MLTESEPAAPSARRWPWKKITIGCLIAFIVPVAAVIQYDQKLEHYEDLMPKARVMGDARTNGFFYLRERWENFPEEPAGLTWRTQEVLRGAVPWDEGLMEKLRPGREGFNADLTAALALPGYAPPAMESPSQMAFSEAWIMPPLRYLLMEAAAARQSGDFGAAIGILNRLHALSRKHMESGGGRISLLVGISMSQLTDRCTCDLLEEDRLAAADLALLAVPRKTTPDFPAAWAQAMKFDVIFFQNSLNLLIAGDKPAMEAMSIRKSRMVFLKKNLTLNKYHRRMRYYVPNAISQIVRPGGREHLITFLSPPPKPKWLRNLNPNYTGEKQLNTGDTFIWLLPGLITEAMFYPQAMQTAMALRQWRLAHDGNWPARLDELVPDYLPAVPLDPWSGRPILWDPAAKVIYSVGADWKPDLPSFGPEERNWFVQDDDYKSPGLRLERAPLPPPALPTSN